MEIHTTRSQQLDTPDPPQRSTNLIGHSKGESVEDDICKDCPWTSIELHKLQRSTQTIRWPLKASHGPLGSNDKDCIPTMAALGSRSFVILIYFVKCYNIIGGPHGSSRLTQGVSVTR